MFLLLASAKVLAQNNGKERKGKESEIEKCQIKRRAKHDDDQLRVSPETGSPKVWPEFESAEASVELASFAVVVEVVVWMAEMDNIRLIILLFLAGARLELVSDEEEFVADLGEQLDEFAAAAAAEEVNSCEAVIWRWKSLGLASELRGCPRAVVLSWRWNMQFTLLFTLR